VEGNWYAGGRSVRGGRLGVGKERQFRFDGLQWTRFKARAAQPGMGAALLGPCSFDFSSRVRW